MTHCVKRAVIMAAGRGERLRPVTDRIPKPLIPVHGRRMIDTIIKALHQNGIREIHVVTGYRGEDFEVLKRDFPGVDLIPNPDWDRCNNISSLYAARAYLEDAMILDGDQIIRDPAALDPVFEFSGYNGVWTDRETGEWLMTADNGIITGCSRTGGKNGWQLYSVSRWTAEDGRQLRKQLETEFKEKGNTGIYWDDVPMFCYPETYTLAVHPMGPDDVREIDSLPELAAEDPEWAREIRNEFSIQGGNDL